MVASSIWLPLASSTSINKLQFMPQHLHYETLILPIYQLIQLNTSQYKQKTQHPSHPLHKHTTYFNIPRLKSTIFNNGRYTTNIPTDPHTITTRYIKTYIRHIHTYIVSKHLATRGNNKILYTPPPRISSSVEIFPRLTRRILAQQINHPYPNHIYTNLTENHIHKHYALSVTLTHTISSTAPRYAPHCHPWNCGQTPPK